jgi:hypothetical protein
MHRFINNVLDSREWCNIKPYAYNKIDHRNNRISSLILLIFIKYNKTYLPAFVKDNTAMHVWIQTIVL